MPHGVFFVDTWLWVARLNKRDSGHERAKQLLEACRLDQLFTSQMVLTEFLNIFADYGEHLRKAACQLVYHVSAEANIAVIDQTPDGFEAGLQRYRTYLDKDWSLTDCASMCIMLEKGISDVLTDDHHFEQAGFIIHN